METTLLALLLIVVFVGIQAPCSRFDSYFDRYCANSRPPCSRSRGTTAPNWWNALEIGAFDRELAALGAEAETAADRAHPTSPAR
jgi:hypothetical protein